MTYARLLVAAEFALMSCSSGGTDASADIIATFGISGTVSGAASSGVTISVGGGATGSTVSDASGHYRLGGLPNGSYVVTPSLPGHAFTPVSRAVSVSGADVTGQDFSSTAATGTHTISGTVGGAVAAGVILSLTGAGTGSTLTALDGTYAFTAVPDGTYALTPTLAGHAFTPPRRDLAVSGADIGGQDFTASAVAVATYSISGAVHGGVTGGVTMTLAGPKSGSTVTDTDGHYRFTGLPGGTYTVAPSRSGYTFEPPRRSVTIDGANELLDAFTAQATTASWALVPSGTSSTLRAIWGSAADDVWIVGDGPILHWDGNSISNMENPAGGSLHAVWGASASDVWAVGQASILHWDGASWTRPASGLAMDIELRGLWGASASDIWAIGIDPWHYDGAVWSRGAATLAKTDASDEMDGIWGSAPNDVWVVGDVVDRFDGDRWGLYIYDCDLHGVWGTSSSNVWAVGTAIAHYDGRRWSFVPSPISEPGVAVTLRAIWGSSTNDIWAVGGGKILHWDGSSWSDVQATTSDIVPLWGVWGSSATDIWMVGENGTLLRYH